MAHLLPEPKSPFETVIYYKRLQSYYGELYNRELKGDTTPISIYELDIFDYKHEGPHKWRDNIIGHNCILCGRPKIEDIILPDELVSKILCSHPKLLYTSLSVSKVIRNYSMKSFILNTALYYRYTYSNNDISMCIYTSKKYKDEYCIQYDINDGFTNIAYNTLILDGKNRPSALCVRKHRSFIRTDTIREIVLAYISKLWNVNITRAVEEAIEMIVDRQMAKYKKYLPGNSYLFYTIMDTYVNTEQFNNDYVLKYYDDNKV